MGTGWGTAGASCFSSTFLGRAIALVVAVVVVVWRVWQLLWLRAAASGLQSGGLEVNVELARWSGGPGAGCSWCGVSSV